MSKGYLILENGQVFRGDSFGDDTQVSGEVVFNTGMVGYPEAFTDPSYYGQILTLTYPLIGNYGVPHSKIVNRLDANFESEKIQIKGLLISEYIANNTHWQSGTDLSFWLKKNKVPALSGIDTRTLTKIIRKTGVMKGIITFEKPRQKAGLIFEDINKINLVSLVSCRMPIIYGHGKFTLLLIDCGLKFNQIRMFLNLGIKVIRVPWNYNMFSKDQKFSFDAIFISNGPGDPKMADAAIRHVREAIKRQIPIFGICLGNQILALASGADTYKLKYGHRGQNQPVIENNTKRCFITTHNHGFAVDANSLLKGWEPWFTNLNDHTNEGMKHKNLPFMSVQFHPESMPGPTDTEWLFQYFIDIAKKWLKKE